jgi:hypothetical protein
MIAPLSTSFVNVPKGAQVYSDVAYVEKTEPKPEDRANYKGLAPAHRLTPERLDSLALAMATIQISEPVAQQSELPIQRVRGVVDRVEGTLSHVTLLYDDRENQFSFPTSELQAAGAAYVGALFDLTVGRERDYISHTLVHAEEEENEARQKLGSIDLSFLDE